MSTNFITESVSERDDERHVAKEPRDWLTFEALAVLAFAVACVAVFLAIFSVGLATRSIDEHRAIPADGSSGTQTAVSLSEFAIAPGPLEVASGGSLLVTNDGNAVHDLAVEGGDATPQLNPGDQAELEVSSLEPGEYAVFCQIPGHRDSGMETQLTVG